MKRNIIEAVLGAVVLVIAAMFLAFAYSVAAVKSVGGYDISATFDKVGGLQRGSDVRISGIAVGSVVDQSLNPQTFQADVKMKIAANVSLSTDTQAAIVSDGLLGSKYVNLTPGRAQDKIKPDGVITHTQDYQSVEDMVSQFIFLATNSSESGGQAKPDASKMDAPK